MATEKVPVVDYSSRDYASIKEDLVRLIPFYCKEWTDHNPTDFGIVLIELLAYVADVLHFYVDRAAGESFLPTAVSRESIINLCKLIDYELRGATAATVELKFAIAKVLASALVIPAGTKCQTKVTAEPIFFETNSELTIPIGNLSGTVIATEGSSKEEFVGPSDGKSFQRYRFAGTPIIEGSLKVLIDEGLGEEEWMEVDSFIRSKSTDKHYYIARDEEERITIFFGDNGQGKIPEAGATIKGSYRIGGGSKGNVGANTIETVVSTIMHEGSPITVNVTNEQAASGGQDRESIDEAKRNAPKSLRALNRAVTKEDFITLSVGYSGVVKASAEFDSGTRIVTVYIVPGGGGSPSTELIANLESYLNTRRMLGVGVDVEGASYVAIDIEGTVYVKDAYVQAEVQLAVEDAVDEYFSLESPNIDLGLDIFVSDIYDLLSDVGGVDHVDLTKLAKTGETGVQNISIADNEMPVKGTVNLSYTGGTL